MQQSTHPLMPIPDNLAEHVAAETRAYNASKASHEDKRDEWQELIYDAATNYRATFRQLASWTGVSEARIGVIVARMTAQHQQRALRAA